MNSILQHQENYIATEDETELLAFYNELVKLGNFIAGRKYFNDNSDYVHDIACKLVLKLQETKQPVLQAPSHYLNSAIYRLKRDAAKKPVVLQLEEHDDFIFQLSQPSFENDLIDSIEYEELLEELSSLINEKLSNTDNCEELKELVLDCLQGRKDFNKYLYKIRNQKMKQEFISVFNSIKEYLHDRCNSRLD